MKNWFSSRSSRVKAAIVAVVLLGVLFGRTAYLFAVCRLNQPGFIIHAIDSNDFGRIEFYVKSGADINRTWERNGRLYLWGDRPWAQEVLAKEQVFPLAEAVLRGYPEVVRLLIDHGANVNNANQLGLTALHYATAQSDRSDAIVDLLLRSGANINAIGPSGFTPLDLADITNTECIQQLLDEGGLAGGQKYSQKEIVKMVQTEPHGNREGLNQLIHEKRTKLAGKQQTLDETLCRAASKQVPSTVELLLNRGANPNAIALDNKVPPVLLLFDRSLLEVNNDSNRKAMLKESPRGQCVELLIRRGAKIKGVKDELGRTPLHYACIFHDYECAKVLLENGADPNVKDGSGRTPYSYLITVEKVVR